MKRKLPPSPPADMPRTKKTKTVAKRKSTWKSRQGFEKYLVAFPKSVFPFQRYATLKYCEAYTDVNPGAGQSSALIMRANDVYDPNRTAVGHQPTGFDQYMAMYNKFCVEASKIKVVAYTDDSNTLDTVVGVALMDSDTTQTTTEIYMEQH